MPISGFLGVNPVLRSALTAVNAANILSILQKAETAKATNNEHALRSFLYLLCADVQA